MRNGPILFIFGIISLVASWGCLVMSSVIQVGSLTSHTDLVSGAVYPVNRPGMAQQGAEVYRELGCNQCHTRFTVQDGLHFGADLTKVGKETNSVEILVATLRRLRSDWSTEDALAATTNLPAAVLEKVIPYEADRAVTLFKDSKSKGEMTVFNVGTDIDRGWGQRQSVARDFVFDRTILGGSQRVGPDLANIGNRAPENHVGAWKFASQTNLAVQARQRMNWQYVHLYNPRVHVPNSTMPSYRFLFEEVSIHSGHDAAGAVRFPHGKGPAGMMVMPKPSARALVAWLVSQQADIGLPESPTPRVEVPVVDKKKPLKEKAKP
jgi:cbb3-type cytochrome oxidase cytochrome c subunit